MLRRKFGRLATMSLALTLALLGGASDARADLSLYIAEDAGPFVLVSSVAGDILVYTTPTVNFDINIDTVSTNFTGTAQSGQLDTTVQARLRTGVGSPHTLRVLAAVTTGAPPVLAPFTLPAGPAYVLESNLGSSGSETLAASGATITFRSVANATGAPVVAGIPAVGVGPAPAVVDANGSTASPLFPFASLPGGGYTLYNLTTISLVNAGTTVLSAGSSTVTAVPEASTVVMSSLMALMGLGYGWRKRTRATA